MLLRRQRGRQWERYPKVYFFKFSMLCVCVCIFVQIRCCVMKKYIFPDVEYLLFLVTGK